MARVKRGVTAHARHKKVLDLAKGYRGRGSKAYRVAGFRSGWLIVTGPKRRAASYRCLL